MTPDELEVLILETRNTAQLPPAFQPLDEKARANLSTSAQKLFSQLYRSKADHGASDRLKSLLARRTGDQWQHWSARETRNATLALFALGPLSAVKKRVVQILEEDRAILDRIIRDRRPDWLDAWIAHDLESGQPSQLDFPILRGWIRDGIARKPETDNYYRMFAWSMMWGPSYRRAEVIPPISVQLLADPALLEDIDCLFRVKNIPAFNTSWLGRDSPEHETWPDALVKLSAAGRVDRNHLLNLALEALTRDFNQNELSGFRDFYKRLAPAADEVVQHQQRYMDLLCHPVGHVVKFALDMLSEVQENGALDSPSLLREIPAVLSSGSKGNALSALKLLKRALGRRKAAEPETLGVVCEALRHAHSDVQALALDLLEANAGVLDGRRDILESTQSFVAASNRARLAKLLADVAPQPGSATRANVSRLVTAPQISVRALGEAAAYRAISDDVTRHAVLRPEDAITPIETPDALIAAILHAVAIVESPDEIERIIDAISRLADIPPTDLGARVAPLLHRLESEHIGSNGVAANSVGVGAALLNLIYAWSTGKLRRTPSYPYIQEDAFVPVIAHLRAVAERVADRRSRQLLSAPTHKGGWIDPLAWVERLHALQGEADLIDSMDFRLSLLRLAPENREQALERAATLTPPLRRLAMFALGGEEHPARADRGNYAAWITAARCRAPHRDWSAEFAILDLHDAWPDSLSPAEYRWRSSHRSGRNGQHRWTKPELKITVASGLNPSAPGRTTSILGRIAQAVSGQIATDWAALPSAALNRRVDPERRWSSELNTPWITQWLAYIWPQNPAGAHMTAAGRLVEQIDQDSSSWTPGFGYFQALFQHNRPWREAGHLLLCLGLVGKDADAKGLAVDALIEGIDTRRFDPSLFAATMAGLAEGEWIKFNRLGDALMRVIQVTALHAAVVSEALQQSLPRLDLQQKNAFRLLEVIVEAQAITGQPLGQSARAALERINGSGKAAKLAKQLLKS